MFYCYCSFSKKEIYWDKISYSHSYVYYDYKLVSQANQILFFFHRGITPSQTSLIVNNRTGKNTAIFKTLFSYFLLLLQSTSGFAYTCLTIGLSWHLVCGRTLCWCYANYTTSSCGNLAELVVLILLLSLDNEKSEAEGSAMAYH